MHLSAPPKPVRLIAFYLPQFHPIPENDAWWGKGFTEWTNVTRARPLFPGHAQPHLPADLGFYDLRLPEARAAQAELAQAYGLHGFCYYHYWFHGKRLLERPFDEVLATGQPDFPFCLCWANANWTRAWDGRDHQVLMPQQYSEADDRAHIRWLLRAFADERYLRVGGKPLFLVWRASQLPVAGQTTARWREEARRAGIGELYLCRVESFAEESGDPGALGFDAAVEFQPRWHDLGATVRVRGNRVCSYGGLVARMEEREGPSYRRFPCVTPSWDNTPRKIPGLILTGSTPGLYEHWLRHAIQQSVDGAADEKLVFINAWNEWAEGCHLEPCQQWGRAYLEATQRVLRDRLDQSHRKAQRRRQPGCALPADMG
jgi:lipopolysaccharide biosynthesis protein